MANRSHDDFLCLSPLPGEAARVCFDGDFQGRPTRWDMQLQTLAHWRRGAAGEVGAARGVIEVGGERDGARAVVVALDVPSIDRPTVRKAVTMIRHYRALGPGRHVWGTAREERGP